MAVASGLDGVGLRWSSNGPEGTGERGTSRRGFHRPCCFPESFQAAAGSTPRRRWCCAPTGNAEIGGGVSRREGLGLRGGGERRADVEVGFKRNEGGGLASNFRRGTDVGAPLTRHGDVRVGPDCQCEGGREIRGGLRPAALTGLGPLAFLFLLPIFFVLTSFLFCFCFISLIHNSYLNGPNDLKQICIFISFDALPNHTILGVDFII